MYCNQIFSILKKVEPVTETPVEETPEEVVEETTTEETTEEVVSEEQSEPVTVSEEETQTEEPIEEGTTSEENIEETPVEGSTETEPEDPIEEETEPEETESENTEEESPIYVIANVIVCPTYEIASRIARCEFGESALAIDTTLYPVAIGDFYKDGVFYDPLGNEIKRNLTESEQIEALTLANVEQKKIIELQAEEIALLNETLLEMLMG